MEKFSLAGRGQYLNGQDTTRTCTPQDLREVTLIGSYKWLQSVKTGLECHNQSGVCGFDQDRCPDKEQEAIARSSASASESISQHRPRKWKEHR
jgi:hypothetical protein